MSKVQEQQRAYSQRLLTDLREELTTRGLATVLVVDQQGRPALEVVDCHLRIRRVYVHLAFCWFYWGDQPDERISCLKIVPAADRVEQAAKSGWREGEQGDLGVNLRKVIDAYRS